jgi:hypothetical protein
MISIRLGLALSVLTGLNVFAQTFTGANAPGSFQDFAINVGPGATNLAILIPGNTNSFSHLLLKKGVAPSDTSYDFIALANGQTNAINLESPEFAVTNYVLRVRTPTNSSMHNFTVTVATNVLNLRTLARPATKAILALADGVITSNSWHYFRVDIATNLPGWRVVLYSTNNNINPDLYLQTNQVPATTNFLKRSTALNPDTLTFTNLEANPGAYFIGVFLPGTTNVVRYTLAVELTSTITLTWDPGTTHSGTQVYTNQNSTGGDYYFRIVTQNTALGAWRTALNVLSGEANVYLQKGVLPTTSSATYKSERIGSDGFVAPATAFLSGEEWFLMVRGTPGSQWTLVTGEPFSLDLGVVATNNASGSGDVPIGAEGIRFFKTTTPGNTLAWRLWLKGLTNTILVKKVSVPVATTADLSQNGQMLVVPPYLVAGQLYFVGVAGAPGTVINLDSRQHTATDISFQSATSLSVTGYPYTTYRVQVPLDQIAWQISVVVSNGNPNVAVRRNFIPNEFNNEAYSEVPGTVTDSISLVPPTLSDGTFFITVYGTNAHTCTLQNGTPVVTDINFTSMTVNDDPNRAGWRYFRISDLNQQLGTLGWDLFLQNFAPGTRIGLRRNAVPSLWNTRNNGVSSSVGFYESLSAGDFLQHPAHQADIWYVGVYNPNTALGPFTLITQPLTAQPVTFDGGVQSRTNVPTGKWQFFQFNVPPNALGWDLRFAEVTNGSPRIVVRRDQLPTAWTNLTSANIPWNAPGSSFTFPSGNQWRAEEDWTRREFSANGIVDETGRLLAMGMGQPLEPATYYVGVIDVGGSNAMNYSISSRGIGTGFTIPVNDLDYHGGTVTATLPAREAAYYRVQIATNTPSWKVRLAATSGDVMLIVLTNHVPNVDSGRANFGKLMQKIDNEHYLLLPGSGKTAIPAGNYYLAVVSEGSAPTIGRIGTGSSTFTLTSQGPLPILNLGTLTGGGADLTQVDSLEGGEVKAYTFATAADTMAFELRLEDRVGNPVMVAGNGEAVPDPGQFSALVPTDAYGNEGGFPGSAAPDLITCANCDNLFATVVVKARGSGGIYSNASYTLHLHSVPVDPLPFDGGSAAVPVQTWGTFRYWEIDVPTNALGWDFRVKDVSGTGVPHMVIGREFLPGSWTTVFNPAPGNAEFWPFGAQWAAQDDWTSRTLSPTGVNENGRLLAMGMGSPLEPGRYIVGVLNDTSQASADTSYSVLSRGIGPGFTIPVVDLAFSGGVASHPGLAPREAAYFRVEIPDGAPSWQVKVSTNAGEVMLVIRADSIPNVDTGQPTIVGKSMQKLGSEQYVLLPTNNPPQTALPGGTYYLAVVSEGMNATNSTRIGVGNSSFTITSLGPMSVTNLGTVAAATDVVHAVTNQEGGQVRGFQFSVPPGISSLEVHLDNRVGNPVLVVRNGAEMPDPGSSYTALSAEPYGNEGGYTVTSTSTNAGAAASLVTLANPPAGLYSMVVKARATSPGVFPDASYTIRISALAYTDVAFDCGTSAVSNQLAGTWRYFHVEVPANALGWDCRLANVSNGTPRMVVRRDLLPNSLLNSGWAQPAASTNWPSGNQWAANNDWTYRPNSATGGSETFRILASGIGQPLEPGTYYVGVYNNGVTTNLSYNFVSRGIGDGFCLPMTDIPFAGGSVTNNGQPPRDAAYYRIQIPSGAPSLKVRLASTAGELMMIAMAGRVPAVDSGRTPIPGLLMQKAGDEHYLLLPAAGQSFLTPGPLYLAVVSEGINPLNTSQIGNGSSSYVITCSGPIPIFNLGTIGSTDLVRSDSLGGGEVKAYQFTVPPGASLEARLENRIGNPVMVLRSGGLLPAPGQGGAGFSLDTYGGEGGQVPANIATNNITLPSPTNGLYTLVVKARVTAGIYPDANYTVRVRQVPVIDLNFSDEQNTNGLSNVASGVLADNQRAYYRVVVPVTNNGLPVIGWRLELAQSSGLASVRARPTVLPDDAVTTLMPFGSATAIIAPPFLTNGTWYVEVRGSNSTAFTLTSRALLLQRPAWAMPMIGQPTTTPGLVAPNFGDSGLDTNGLPLPGDQGTDLAQGGYHYYAVTVPPTNSGIMRVQLTAISGNPDLYIRTNFVPTISHRGDGQAGTIYDRLLASSVSEYGNFVPIGRTEFELFPGTYYIGVRAAGNANAHYRLRLSSGNVQDLPFQGGSASGQVVAGADWRYYRVQFPQDGPTNWWVTFNQQAGDVVMYVRDTVPPGNGASLTDLRDWNTDNKNIGPYPNYDAPGTYLISTPQLRPGSVYYLGFKANNDAIFTVSNNIAGLNFALYPTIEFYGGSVSNVLAPNSEVTYRIFAPRDATRWRHYATNSSSVSLFVENGFLPTKSAADDYRSTGANSSLSQYLLSTWPWVPDANYYLTITNTSVTPQPYIFTMDGRNALTDDNDVDGMPDAWERLYFGGSTTPPAAGDFDGDGVSNLNEYLEGTNPADPNSLRPRLVVNATNGVVNVNPAASNYTYGAQVTLTPVPAAGYGFVNWIGQASGTANPLVLTMTNSRTITAIFRAPGDDFAQRIPITGWSNTVTGFNTNATKEPGEPSHVGNAGGRSVWWTWTALSSGNVTITTAGSTFNTLLAIYTGTSVTNLAGVAANDNDDTNVTSKITFAATAGVAYAIAVDGFDGASGNIVLQVKEDAPPIIITAPLRLGDGRFQFTLIAEPGYNYDIQASANLVDWPIIATLPNPSGTITFVDANAPLYPNRSYRAARAALLAGPLELNADQLANGQFSFILNSAADQVIRIESGTNLVDWVPLVTVTNTTGTLQLIDPTPTTFNRRFYRAVVQ